MDQLFLDPHNKILEQLLHKNLAPGSPKLENFAKFADFDGALHTVSVKDGKVIITCAIVPLPALLPLGAEEYLNNEFGPAVSIAGDTVTLTYDPDALPEPFEQLIEKISLMKVMIFSAPARRCIEAAERGAPLTEVMEVPYRPDEKYWLVPGSDGFLICYGINFLQEHGQTSDMPIAKVFMTEFQDIGRQPGLGGAPGSSFAFNSPPTDITSKFTVDCSKYDGFVSFTFRPRHYASPELKTKVLAHIAMFRDYLHYHIKCTKAYIHSRMRSAFRDLQQSLNRARRESAHTGTGTATGTAKKSIRITRNAPPRPTADPDSDSARRK